MTSEEFDTLLEIQHRQMIALERLVYFVEQLVPEKPIVPNYKRSLNSFHNFDWASIGATVEKSDQYGAAIVSWKGLRFVRRTKNGITEGVWFSRRSQDENGEDKFENLIAFNPTMDTTSQ